MRSALNQALSCVAVAIFLGLPSLLTQAIAATLPPVTINDNRTPAGVLRNGVLSLRLEIREGIWHPLEEDGDAIPIFAFAEVGKQMQAPAPLIRVPEGTRIEVTLRNATPVPAVLHGLHQRPGKASELITVQPGETREIRFLAGLPGTYSYWVAAPVDGAPIRRLKDSQLAGAFVVDAPGATPQDRIFLLTRWNGPQRTMINGKSWPFTERFTFEKGETVRWKWINASDVNHPMHLHGSYFNVEGVGNGETFTRYDDSTRLKVATHLVDLDETYEMTWVPETPGRWTYHCHKLVHMRLPVPMELGDIGGTPVAMDEHSKAHDVNYAGMGGMILGITVVDSGKASPATTWRAERKLNLRIGERKANPSLYELTLSEPGIEPGIDAARPTVPAGVTPLVGPPIILQQNQPVEITVENQSHHATAIHWHGIELESYYDGVPMWGGKDQKRSPAVEPGESFVARMAPPTAGTFIYHTHYHDENQLTNGILGPIIVLPAGTQHDPETDKAFLFALGPANPFGPVVLLNGLPQPTAMQLSAGQKYRMRFINISAAFGSLRVSLRPPGEQQGKPVAWRVIKKDGADLPSAYDKLQPASLQVSVGETFDVEFESSSPQELLLEGANPDGRRASQLLNFRPKAQP